MNLLTKPSSEQPVSKAMPFGYQVFHFGYQVFRVGYFLSGYLSGICFRVCFSELFFARRQPLGGTSAVCNRRQGNGRRRRLQQTTTNQSLASGLNKCLLKSRSTTASLRSRSLSTAIRRKHVRQARKRFLVCVQDLRVQRRRLPDRLAIRCSGNCYK